ncbi:MAG: hypothetical protein DHS20C14_05760 [Phycisphaeraceae bacterium]|nr:MAG: hypothetical protein DHS20C14_05760 [Phycisphaeraceae bacterium]
MATKRKTKPYRVSEDEDVYEEGWPVGRALVWLAFAGIWVFAAIALVSFDAGDAPSNVQWPHNEPPANWAGSIGAQAAYRSLRLLGIGMVVPMLFAAGTLLSTAMGRGISQPIIRAIGVVLIAVSAATLAHVGWPNADFLAGHPGGTAGKSLAAALLPGLNVGGTVLVLLVMLAVGLVVACDSLVWRAPAALWRVLVPAAAGTGHAARAVGSAAGRSAGAGTGLMAWIGSVLNKPRLRRVAINDLGDEALVEERRKAKKKAKTKSTPKPRKKVELVEEDEYEEEWDEEDALDGDEDEWEPEDGDEEYEEEDEYEDEYEDEEDEVGAPQVFSREALKKKIAALPVRFSQENRNVATEEDLADMQTAANLEGYKFPTLDLLEEPEEGFNEKLEELVRGQAEALESALSQFRIDGEVVDIESGPAITLYHIRLAPGTKVAAINTISSDLARSLKAVNIRVVANVEGRDTIGIEVPNPTKERVRLKELMGQRDRFSKMKLPMFLGKDAAGDPLIGDLTKMPHMLIAGTTGSGKSVCMNTIIMSFLYTKKPNELKLVLVDPKMVEMSQFKDIPHLMCPVVTEMSKAAAILEWAVTKMDERYELLAEAGCRDIASYNALDEEELFDRFTPVGPEGRRELSEDQKARIPRMLPYMVFIIDELADLMMTHKEVEGSIIRIAQKARAVGIHLILATQRPQANVVTGLIKSNMPCRIAFKVASGMDSRIVLDQKGGELLLGMGDMLFLDPSSHKLKRSQGTLVDDHEIRKVTRFLKDIAGPSFERQLVQLRSGDDDEERIYESKNNSSASLAAAQEDPMFDRAVEIVIESKRGSVSLLQRRLAIGYTRASRLVDLMGIAGIISDHKGSVARDVLITIEEWEAIKELAAEEAAAQEASGTHPDVPNQTLMFDGSGGTATATAPAGADTEAVPFDVDDDAAAVEVHGTQLADDEAVEVADDEAEAEDDEEEWEEEDEYEDGEEEEEEDEDPEAEYEEVDGEEEDEEEEYEEEDAVEGEEDEEEDDPEAEYEDEEEDEEEYEEVGEDEEEEEDEEDPDAEYEEADEEEEYEEEDELEEEEEPEVEVPAAKKGRKPRGGTGRRRGSAA